MLKERIGQKAGLTRGRRRIPYLSPFAAAPAGAQKNAAARSVLALGQRALWARAANR